MAKKWMKQGSATTEAHKDLLTAGDLYRRRRHRRLVLNRAGINTPRIAPALPALVGKRPRLDITHVGRCFRP